MTTDTETILIKLLERLESQIKENNRKLEQVITDVNQVNVNTARLEGKVETLPKK